MSLAAARCVTGVYLVLIAAPPGAEAQPEGRAALAGALCSGSTARKLEARREPFKRHLRQPVRALGVDVALDRRRYGVGSAAQLPAQAIGLVGK